MESVDIRKLSYSFALKIIELYKFLLKKKEFIISKQILRCGTSIGANVEEAQAGQTKKDFTAKMSIAAKEARETNYWLNLLKESEYLNGFHNKDDLINDLNIIIKTLTKIVKTSQEKIKK
ncbi:MAG TPA: four helix bundle protein [Bacteroidales bacterium]|nr:four helix bundle protein [Bacteroidales bacterium]